MKKDPNKYIEWADREQLSEIHSGCRKLAVSAACMISTKDEREFVRMLREIRDVTNRVHWDVLEVLMAIGATRVDRETGETYDVNEVLPKKQAEDTDEEGDA